MRDLFVKSLQKLQRWQQSISGKNKKRKEKRYLPEILKCPVDHLFLGVMCNGDVCSDVPSSPPTPSAEKLILWCCFFFKMNLKLFPEKWNKFSRKRLFLLRPPMNALERWQCSNGIQWEDSNLEHLYFWRVSLCEKGIHVPCCSLLCSCLVEERPTSPQLPQISTAATCSKSQLWCLDRLHWKIKPKILCPCRSER